jgi:predicted MFS family arabinose efflux permease
MTGTKLKMPFILWVIVTSYFAFQFILRLLAGILREDLMAKFAVDTVAFGNLAGFYYLGYAGMQIPIGYMLDRYNFRFVTFISIIVASIGTVIFAFSNEWEYVLFGRFLIGAGSAVGFLAVAKVIKTFFPERMHSLMIGFAFTIGLTGAVMGGKPVKYLFDTVGYSYTFKYLVSATVLIGFLVLLVNDKKIQKYEYESDKPADFVDTLKIIFNPTIIFIGVCGGLMVGSLEGFADVWAIPFFTQIYNFSEYDSITATSIVYTGMCVGGPLLAWCAEYFKSNIFMILVTGILTSIIFIVMFMHTQLSYNIVIALMFLIGILCCYQVLVFTLASEIVGKNSAGIAIAIVNCINMSFGHFFHVMISNIIQSNWDGSVNNNNMPLYDIKSFILALSPVPTMSLIGGLGFLYLSILNKKGKLKKVA